MNAYIHTYIHTYTHNIHTMAPGAISTIRPWGQPLMP